MIGINYQNYFELRIRYKQNMFYIYLSVWYMGRKANNGIVYVCIIMMRKTTYITALHNPE